MNRVIRAILYSVIAIVALAGESAIASVVVLVIGNLFGWMAFSTGNFLRLLALFFGIQMVTVAITMIVTVLDGEG